MLTELSKLINVNKYYQDFFFQFNTERANSSYCSQVIFRIRIFEPCLSSVITYTSSNFQVQNLSLKVVCNQHLIFQGPDRMTRVPTTCLLAKLIILPHAPTPTLRMPISPVSPHRTSPQLVFPSHQFMSQGFPMLICYSLPTSPRYPHPDVGNMQP